MAFFWILAGLIILGYAVLMFWLFLGIGKLRPSKLDSFKPFVSIIVSLKNETRNINSLLKALNALKYPKELFEIILVDDHSTDSTFKDLQKFESSQILVLSNSGDGKKQAIETGVKKAKGNWIAVTDADCEVPELWVNSMVSDITENSKMILGPVFINASKGLLSSMQAIEFLGLQGATCGSAGRNSPISANGANMLFKKDVFEELKPYSDNYPLKTGDDQFLMMAISSHFPNSVSYSKRADSIVLTQPVNAWSNYLTQRIRWASKGGAYTQFAPKLVGLVVLLASLILVLSFLLSIYLGNWSMVYVLFMLKIMSDFWLVIPMKRLVRIKLNPVYYLISAILYPFVVLLSVLGGYLKK